MRRNLNTVNFTMDEDVEESSYQRKVRLRLQAMEGMENASLYEQQLYYNNESTSEESEYVEDNFENSTYEEYDNLLSMDEDVEKTSYQKRVRRKFKKQEEKVRVESCRLQDAYDNYSMDQSEYDQFTEDENVEESSSQRKVRCTHEKIRPSSEKICKIFKDFEAGGKAVCPVEKPTWTDDIGEPMPKRLHRQKSVTVSRISAEKQLQKAVLSISVDFEDWKVYVPESLSDEEEKIPNSKDQQAVEKPDGKSDEKAEEKTDEKLNEKSERKTDKKSDEKLKQTQDQTLNQIYDQAEQLKVETFYQSLGLSTALIYNSEYVQMLNVCATESVVSDVSLKLKAKVRNKVMQELQDELKDGEKLVLREASMTPTPFEELPKMLRTECSNFERLDIYTRIDLDLHLDLGSLTDKKLPEQVEYDKYIHVVSLWIKGNKNAWIWENGACFMPNANEHLVAQVLEIGKLLGCKTRPRIRHSHIGRVLRFPWPIDVDKFCKYYGLSDPVFENDRKVGYYVHKNLEGVFAKVFASGLVEIYAMNPGESTEMLVLLDLLTNPRYADEE